MYPYAESKLDTFLLLQTDIAVSHGSKKSQPGTYCSLGVIFMGLGITEVHEKPISEQLGDMPIIALDNFGTHPLICTHYVPVLFGIKLAGEFRGVHQVAKHDGQLTAFSFWGVMVGWWRFGSRLCFLVDRLW